MDTQRLTALRDVYRDGLLDDVIPFWLTHGLDHEFGGYMNSVDRDGTLLDTDKGGWQQGRTAFTFGRMYNTVEQKPEWLAAAKLGIDFFLKHGFDTNGQMFFHLTREGEGLRRRRYAFGEPFAAMALAEYSRATGCEESAAKAHELYGNYSKFSGNAELTGFAPKFTDVRPTRGIGHPMIQIVTAQILRDCLGDDNGYSADIDACIADIREFHMKPELKVVMETVAPDGSIIDHFDGRTLNPGHAIEAAWFILHEAKHRGGDAELVRVGCDILDWMWDRGWDKEYGGMLYFTDLYGKPVQEYWHDMKFWWPHNETIIATLYAYAMTGDEKYAAMHQQVHDWTYSHFPDPEFGEWYGYLHRDGRVSSPAKGNLWKGPFHMPRQKLVCWNLCEELLARKQ